MFKNKKLIVNSFSPGHHLTHLVMAMTIRLIDLHIFNPLIYPHIVD